MAAAAQLAGELAALDNAHDVAVLLAKERRHAGFASGVERGLVDIGGDGGHDFLVRDALDLGQLLGRGGLKVREVEAKAVGPNVGTCLLHVIA